MALSPDGWATPSQSFGLSGSTFPYLLLIGLISKIPKNQFTEREGHETVVFNLIGTKRNEKQNHSERIHSCHFGKVTPEHTLSQADHNNLSSGGLLTRCSTLVKGPLPQFSNSTFSNVSHRMKITREIFMCKAFHATLGGCCKKLI